MWVNSRNISPLLWEFKNNMHSPVLSAMGVRGLKRVPRYLTQRRCTFGYISQSYLYLIWEKNIHFFIVGTWHFRYSHCDHFPKNTSAPLQLCCLLSFALPLPESWSTSSMNNLELLLHLCLTSFRYEVLGELIQLAELRSCACNLGRKYLDSVTCGGAKLYFPPSSL